MLEANHVLGIYLHLVRASHLRRQPMVRDKLLALAGVTAAEMGLDEIAATCRERILAHNARHLVRRWPTLAEALADPQFQSYLKQLRRRYSPEKAEHMLDSLGIELARERESYFSDHEYAAALPGRASEPDTTPIDPGSRAAAADRRTPDLPLPAGQPRLARATAPPFWSVWGPFALGVLVVLLVALLRGHSTADTPS